MFKKNVLNIKMKKKKNKKVDSRFWGRSDETFGVLKDARGSAVVDCRAQLTIGPALQSEILP